MNIATALARARPHLIPEEDYRVVDYSDGEGPQLQWFTSESRPTEAELQAADVEATREAKRAEIRADLVTQCAGLMPVYEFVYCVYAKVADERLPRLAELAKAAREREKALDKASSLQQMRSI